MTNRVHVAPLPSQWPDERAKEKALQKMRSLRLQSLKLDPSCFGSSYELEITFTKEKWLQRLDHDKAQHVVAFRESSASDLPIGNIEDAEWIGSAVIFESEKSTSSEYIGAINGLYVRKSERGQALGRRLIQACLDFARAFGQRSGMKRVRVEIVVDVDNHVAHNLYASCGFTSDDATTTKMDVDGRDEINMSQEFDIDIPHPNS